MRLLRLVHSQLRAVGKRLRSPKWRAVEKAHLAAQPVCAACGGAVRLQVHHIRPFHLDPKLELDPTNLITLCMSTDECHLRIGHGDSFKFYNAHVVQDAAFVLRRPSQRSAVEHHARDTREPL